MAENEAIASALVAALADLTVVEKGRTADTGKYSYDYADIADVVKLTRPALADHGLVALTPVHSQGAELACTVTLLHTSGERLDFGPFTFPHGKDAQSTGSWVTYVRRYALVAALGIAAGDDDDGAGAHSRQAQPQRQQRPQQPPSGITSEELFERLTQFVAGRIEDPDGEHAKGAWKAAKPKAVDGVIPDAEVERVMAEADRYLASVAEGG